MAKILLVVSGGIAAYKAPELVRELKRGHHEVRVVMTQAAGAFVSSLALASVSGHPVRSKILDASEEGTIGHIELADWPDLIVVAPATANLLARAAHGLADDLASTILLATRAPILWAPAMNVQMWSHPRTQSNVASLAKLGHGFVGPDRGELACGWIGEGRMMDPSVIATRASQVTAAAATWRGRRVLVSAGPTRAYLDPVRFLTNASSGVMGFAVAEAAAKLGADVCLVAGPVSLPTPGGVRRVDVETADQMFAALEAELIAGADLLAMVAAVADLKPLRAATDKVDKEQLIGQTQEALQWTIERDLVATLCERFGAQTRFLAFAAQTVAAGVASTPTAASQMAERGGAIAPTTAGEEGPEEGGDAQQSALLEALSRMGADKLRRKGVDAIFVNQVGAPGVGFASETNTGLLLVDCLERLGGADSLQAHPRLAELGASAWTASDDVAAGAPLLRVNAGPRMPKAQLARWLLDCLDASLTSAGWWPRA